MTNGKDNVSISQDDIRNKILEMFLSRPNEYVSGTELSTLTGVSRTAVWKHIRWLEEAGFEFESSSRVGYRVRRIPDVLLPAVVRNQIPAGQDIGQNIIWYPQTDSTNVQAAKWVGQGAPHGTVIVASEQVGGKGRRGRAWFSPQEGLWFSVILRISIPIRKAADLTLLTSVAVRRVLTRYYGLPVLIKWPNDLLVHQKKVCGILAEIRADGETLEHAVVGVGINTNIPASDFPTEVRTYATSLLAESGQSVPNTQIAVDIFKEMDTLFTKLVTEGAGFETVVQEWREYSATLGKPVRVQAPGGLVEGTAVDIDPSGVLVIQQENGELIRIFSGDVLF